MKWPHIWVLAGALLTTLILPAQPVHQLTNRIPVTKNGQSLAYAWSGGMNTPQFSDVDLNRDGIADLVVFHRDEHVFTTFLNHGQPSEIGYTYAPAYQALFDSCQCREWALFVDYNGDGREDLFCGRVSGSNFLVYENVPYGTDSMAFELRYDPLFVQSGNNQLWLFQVRSDLPAIVDVDYDGDVDIIASTNFFNWFLLHRNRSVEDYGRTDTLVFQTEPGCWGDFLESNVSNDLLVSDSIVCSRSSDPGGGTGQGGLRHVGSTLLVFDMNDDSLMDVLIGDIEYRSGTAAFNYGTILHADMTEVETFYPLTDSAIDVSLFPGFFYVDVNNDQVRDLIAAPNIVDPGRTETVNGVALYLNAGTDTDVDFRFQGRSLIVPDHIDAGFASVPAFFDHNGDGLTDLLIASDGSIFFDGDTTVPSRTLLLYENTGSLEAPAFTLIDSNYLNINQFSPFIKDPSPAAGDLDGDGDDDLLIGNINGTLLYFINISLPQTPAQYVPAPGGVLKDMFGEPIDAGSVSAPELFDLDGDGDLDLFIGNQMGRIVYYKNVGSATQAQFALFSPTWGKIKLSNESGSLFSGLAKPRFADYDEDGTPELIVGEETGLVEIYDDLHLALTDSLVKVGDLRGVDFGSLAAPAAAILDTSGHYTYVIGNRRGGLYLVQTPIPGQDSVILSAEAPPVNLGLAIYPNPTTGQVTLRLPSGEGNWQRGHLYVRNQLGQLLLKQAYQGAQPMLDLSPLPSGLYIIEVHAPAGRGSGRVQLQNR